MTEKYKSLAQRREELMAQSAIQREQFAAMMSDAWQPGALSTGKNILLQAREKPVVSGLMAILAFLFFRKRRLFSLLAAAVVALRSWTQLAPYILPFFRKCQQYYQKKRLNR